MPSGYVNGSGPILVVSGGTHAALLFANKRERRSASRDDYLKHPLPRVEKYTDSPITYPAIEYGNIEINSHRRNCASLD